MYIFISVDPLAEETMEPYLYTGNNPIMFTDPTGMSKETDYFNSFGIFERRVNDGSNAIKIKSGTTGAYVSPSQLSVSKGSNNAVLNMTKHYRSEMGISSKFRVGVGPSGDKTPSKNNPAFTRTPGNVNYINNVGGYSTALNDVNSFKSVIRHENKHQIDNNNPRFKDLGNITHAGVYLYQMKNQEFKDSPYQFQESMVGSFMNYLYNAQEKGGDPFDIQNSIDSFNGLNTGFSIESGGLRGMGTPKVESYEIKHNGKNIGKPSYKLNNEK